MQHLDLTLPTLAENLALDEALLLEAETGRGGEALRFWEWVSPAVVLGSACRIGDDVFEAACQADRVPLGRRASGGGTVLLGAGCLLFSLVLPYHRDPSLREVLPSYRYILDIVAESLSALLPGIEKAGISDLASTGWKFSGNAQQRKRDHLLHHGTLLYAFDLPRVSRYLRAPPRQPEYRQGRSHEQFLRNLPVEKSDLMRLIRASWHADQERQEWPREAVERLCREKYARQEWVHRR